MRFGEGKAGKKGKWIRAGAAVGLAGLCVTGVASGVACPILMGTAGILAFSALRRTDTDCAACALPTANPPTQDGPR